MRSVMEALLAINNMLYSYKYHLSILVIWLGLLLSPYKWTHYWMLAGLITWLALMIHKFYKSGLKKEVSTLKKIYTDDGMLPFLVGFNISILFGPIGVVLAIVLELMDKDEE